MSKVAEKAVQKTNDVAANAIGDFAKLMKDFNVIGFVLGLLIANGVAEIANSFIDGILMPTIQPVIDRVSPKNAEIRVGGLTFHIEKFLNAILKFLTLSLVIFVLMRLGVHMTRPITWVRVEQIKTGLKL